MGKRKCTIICDKEEELENENIKLYITGRVIKKGRSAVYLGMTMTSNGITENNNVNRGNKKRARTKTAAASARLNAAAPRMRKRYILETYLRSTYGFNAFLLPSTEPIRRVDREVIREMMEVLLKSKEKGIQPSAINTLMTI